MTRPQKALYSSDSLPRNWCERLPDPATYYAASPAQLAALRGLYRQRTAEDLRLDLASQADEIAAAIAEAVHVPTPARLETLALQLDALRQLANALKAALLAESEGAANENSA